MAANRCMECEINFPPHRDYVSCEACGKKTLYSPYHDPQPDYQTAVEWKIKNRVVNQVEPIKPIPNSHATIVEYKGLKWVAHELLTDSGYESLCDFDVVQIAGKFYELQGRIGKELPGLPGGAWWIEELDPDELVETIYALPEVPPDLSINGETP